MIINCENKNGLNGQYTLAQGKRRRSVALGWKKVFEFVREKKLNNESPYFRTKWSIVNFQADNLLNSVRNMNFILNNLSSLTDSSSLSLPRAAFRIIPPETMPWAIICWPFRPEKNPVVDLYIKSRSSVEESGTIVRKRNLIK